MHIRCGSLLQHPNKSQKCKSSLICNGNNSTKRTITIMHYNKMFSMLQMTEEPESYFRNLLFTLVTVRLNATQK